jgi:hypothetical protein
MLVFSFLGEGDFVSNKDWTLNLILNTPSASHLMPLSYTFEDKDVVLYLSVFVKRKHILCLCVVVQLVCFVCLCTHVVYDDYLSQIQVNRCG